MAKLKEWLKKPEYVYRPSQIVRRLSHTVIGKPVGTTTVVLPWALPIEVRPTELIGASIWRMGLYDLAVTEAIWRLLDPGEHAIDAGTNIGHMSSVMAVRVGTSGRVDSFEPHPQILETLRRNVEVWSRVTSVAKINLHPVALTQQAGRVKLNIADDFETNHGGSFLGDETQPPASANRKGRSVEVDASRLDDAISASGQIGLMKIDVEGHELAVLNGATSLFESRAIRDVIFEEHDPFPTEVTAFFERFGFTLFRIEKRFSGLDVFPPRDRAATASAYDPPNYLATLDPDRARQRFATRGWQCLRRKIEMRNMVASHHE